MVEGASLESLYMGNCIVGSNPILSAKFYLMKFYLSILSLFVFFGAFGQEDSAEIKVIDSLYREDQFYINFTSNKFQNLNGLSQSKFSPGFCIGFLRDMPINKRRTFAIATGLGYSFVVNSNNLLINPNQESKTTYSFFTIDGHYNKNKLSLQYIDLPIEIRWRSSTPETHKFWRVYGGFKISYLIANSYKLDSDSQVITYKSNPDINKFQYGCYLATGWNTWNVYAYYGLNPIFKSAYLISGDKININTFNLGLQFYIL